MGVESDEEAPFPLNDEQVNATGISKGSGPTINDDDDNNNNSNTNLTPLTASTASRTLSSSEPNTVSQQVITPEDGDDDAWIIEQKKQAAATAPAIIISSKEELNPPPGKHLVLVSSRTSTDIIEGSHHHSNNQSNYSTRSDGTACNSTTNDRVASDEDNDNDGNNNNNALPTLFTRLPRLSRPKSQPGAYRIDGVLSPSPVDDASVTDSLTPGPDEDNNINNESMITLSAHPVDEALEAERERRLGEQEGEIREKEERIRELERQQKLRRKRMMISLFVVVLFVATISVVASLTAGGGGGEKDTIIQVINNTTQAPTLPQPWKQFGQGIFGENAQDRFGWSVDLSQDGNFLVVGANENDGETNDVNDNRGHVRIFAYNRNSSEWNQLGQDLVGDFADDQFGKTVAVSRDSKTGLVVAAGAPTLPDNDLPGRVKVFWYDGQQRQWTQWGDDLTGDIWYDDFGYEIALSATGTVVAVSCPVCEDETAVGQVRVFQYIGVWNTWEPMGQNINANESQIYFGSSVAISDDGATVVAGAIGTRNNAGSVVVFKYNTDVEKWSQLGQELYGDTEHDWFGYSVALSSSGAILAVGANGANGYDKSGYTKVYRYRPNNDEWFQIGQSIPGESAGDGFGISVGLSNDGYTLIGGASASDSARHNDTGHARVFRFDNRTKNWYQLGRDIEGEYEKDGAGRSVAISGDGTRVAVASPWHDDENGNHTGQVRVFDYME